MAGTIKDVSKKANVSMSTVSHVINGTRYVSDEVKGRVLNAIDEIGYIPNVIAQSLKKSETHTIGLVVSDIKNNFFVDIINTIASEARKDGIQVFISSTSDDSDREEEIIKNLVERRVDGIIFSPTIGSEEKAMKYLIKTATPAVMIDRKVGQDFDWIGSESHDAANELVDYLYARGHRKIAFVVGLKGISTNEARIKGFIDSMKKHQLEINDNWIITGNYRKEPLTEEIVEILKEEKSPTGIVAGNNRMILNIMEALKRLSIDPNKDIELVAFDEGEWAEFFTPHIVALKQPTEEIAKEAYKLLKSRIKNPDDQVKKVVISPKMMER